MICTECLSDFDQREEGTCCPFCGQNMNVLMSPEEQKALIAMQEANAKDSWARLLPVKPNSNHSDEF